MAEMKQLFDCPHCGGKCLFQQILTNDIKCTINSLRQLVWVCQNCYGLIITRGSYSASSPGCEIIPNLRNPKIKVGKLPEHVRKDYQEALACYSLSCHVACVIMCRRTVQRACLDKEAKGTNLLEQIDALVIDENLKKLAHRIRLWGNQGAHPDILLEETLSEADANIAIEFTEQFLQYVYVIPKELEEIESQVPEVEPAE